MIPNKEKITVTGNLTGEDVKMSLDEDSAEHLMDVLTDLYPDPEFAVIREYTTNAFDSHVEAGVTDPIEFESPNRLNSAFVIRDFGVGLNAEDIRRVYSKYGASTKRATNEQTGTLGLGSKAALTYTDQFTVIGTKDGVRTTVSVSRTEDGGGNMLILSEEKTDERNGVEVIVPAPNASYATQRKIEEYFRFWPSGTVKVDGELNEQIQGEKITDRIQAFENNRRFSAKTADLPKLDRDYIVMGNVPYPVDFSYEVKLVVYVDIGEVDFPASRDSLRYNKRTKDAIARIRAEYEERVRQVIQGKIDAAPTKAAALAAYNEIAFLNYGNEDFKWKSTKLPTKFAYPVGKRHNGYEDRRKEAQRQLILLRGATYGKGQSGPGAHRVQPDANRTEFAEAPLFIVNYNNKNWAAPTRRKLDAYVTEQVAEGKLAEGTRTPGAILCRNPVPPNKDWIDVPVLDWAEVKAYRQKGTVERQKVAGTYDVWKFNKDRPFNKYNQYAQYDTENRVAADTIDTTAPLFWSGHQNENLFRDLADTHGEKIQIVVVPNHRQKKFLRSFPEAKSVEKAMEQAAKAWWSALPHYKKQMLRWDESGAEITDWFVKTPLHKIKDPEVREVVELIRCKNKNEALVDRYENTYSLLLNKEDLTFEGINERYPLIEDGCPSYFSSSKDEKKARDHALHYVNAVYEAEKGKN